MKKKKASAFSLNIFRVRFSVFLRFPYGYTFRCSTACWTNLFYSLQDFTVTPIALQSDRPWRYCWDWGDDWHSGELWSVTFSLPLHSPSLHLSIRFYLSGLCCCKNIFFFFSSLWTKIIHLVFVWCSVTRLTGKRLLWPVVLLIHTHTQYPSCSCLCIIFLQLMSLEAINFCIHSAGEERTGRRRIVLW